MKNTLPVQLDLLFTLSEDMADGCHAYEAPIGLMQNKEVNMRGALDTARTEENAYQAARTARLSAVNARNAADAAAITFLTLARDVLKPHIAPFWTQAWVEAGFVGNSIAIPATLAQRLELLMSFHMYFTAHPAYEVAAAGITAAAAQTQHDTLSNARSAVNVAMAVLGERKDARDGAVRELRKRMRGLITELEQLLPGNDARWRAFGLNPPDGVSVPDAPEELTVIGGGSGHLVASWHSTALADRYRVFKKVIGVDNDFVVAATVTETNANLNTFAPGSTVRVRVTAVNDAGESLPSDAVEQIVP